MKRVEQPSIATLSPRPRRSASPEFLPVHNSVGERVPLAGQLHASTVSRFGATTICINRAELPLRNSRLSSTLIARELRKPSRSVLTTCDACSTKAFCMNRAELPLRNSRLSSTLIARELRKPSRSVHPTCDACPTKALCMNRAELPLRNSRLSSTLIARELRKPSRSVYSTCDACRTKASKNEILWISSWTSRGLEVDSSPEGGTLEKGERVPHVCETWNA